MPIEEIKLSPLFDALWSTGHVFDVALRTRFRGLNSREGVLFRGPQGWGEFSPFADYSADRDALWLAAAIETAFRSCPVPTKASVPVNAIIGDTEDARLAARKAALEFGCSTVKIKVGDELETDLVKLEEITSELKSHFPSDQVHIRIDANGRWSLDQARTALHAMQKFPIEYVEQPCADRESLEKLHSEVDVPIAVDESIRIDGETRINEFADIAILKVSPLGGLNKVQALARELNDDGVLVRISGALETSVGLFPSLLAAWELAPDSAAGLGTGVLFAQDLAAETLLPVQGRIAVARVSPDRGKLEAFEGTGAQIDSWRTRTETAFELLPAASIALIANNL